MSDQPTPPPPPPAGDTQDAAPKKKWGCLQWALLAIAVVMLLFGLCTVLVFSNLDFR